MRLTRMQLDLTKRKTMLALYAPCMLHGAIEQAFNGEKKRKLWRVDSLNGNAYLLILSENEPNLAKAVKEFGVEAKPPESKDYSPLLQKIENNTKWQFRLCANPTYSKCAAKTEENDSGKKRPRGKVCAHRTTEHQIKWLLEQSEKHGFCTTKESFSVVKSEWYRFYKNNSHKTPISLLAVTFEGILTVTDAEKLKNALINGIGREKAYGMGLLTLIKSKS